MMHDSKACTGPYCDWVGAVGMLLSRRDSEMRAELCICSAEAQEGRAEAAEALAGSLITQMATGTQHSRGVAGGTLLPEPHGWTGWNTVLILHSGNLQ